MVGATVGEDGRNFQLFRDRSKCDGVAGGDHAGEPVDALRQLHAFELPDVAVDAGGFIGGQGCDLAGAEKSALGIDLVGGQGVPFQRRRAQIGAGARQEGHVTDLERRGGNPAFRRHRTRSTRRCDQRAGSRRRRHAQAAEETAPIHGFAHADLSFALIAYSRAVRRSIVLTLPAAVGWVERNKSAFTRVLDALCARPKACARGV
jgi:hypothetical protein